MRSIVTAFFLAALVCVAHAGVLVELTDGTKLTVESHWNDGDNVHLVRGGVDMIVPKSRIKSIDESVGDPEVFHDGRGTPAAAAEGPKADGDVPLAAAPEINNADDVVPEHAPPDPTLTDMSGDELQVLHEKEAARLLELQEKRFNGLYSADTKPEEQKQVDDAFYKQNRRTAQVWGALEKKRDAEGSVPTVPPVEQPQ
jgi:hypothetical protein